MHVPGERGSRCVLCDGSPADTLYGKLLSSKVVSSPYALLLPFCSSLEREGEFRVGGLDTPATVAGADFGENSGFA